MSKALWAEQQRGPESVRSPYRHGHALHPLSVRTHRLRGNRTHARGQRDPGLRQPPGRDTALKESCWKLPDPRSVLLSLFSGIRALHRKRTLPQQLCGQFHSHSCMDLPVSLYEYCPDQRHQWTWKNNLHISDQYGRAARPHRRRFSGNPVLRNTRISLGTSAEPVYCIYSLRFCPCHYRVERNTVTRIGFTRTAQDKPEYKRETAEAVLSRTEGFRGCPYSKQPSKSECRRTPLPR